MGASKERRRDNLIKKGFNMIYDVILGLVLVALLIAIVGLFRGNKKVSGRTWDNFRLYKDKVIELRARKMLLTDKAY